LSACPGVWCGPSCAPPLPVCRLSVLVLFFFRPCSVFATSRFGRRAHAGLLAPGSRPGVRRSPFLSFVPFRGQRPIWLWVLLGFSLLGVSCCLLGLFQVSKRLLAAHRHRCASPGLSSWAPKIRTCTYSASPDTPPSPPPTGHACVVLGVSPSFSLQLQNYRLQQPRNGLPLSPVSSRVLAPQQRKLSATA
jgi:hypothetical protein